MRIKRTPRERFEHTTLPRVQVILDYLDLLWRSSNRRYYEYDEKDVKKIFTAIREKVDQVEEAFRPVSKPVKKKFKLD